MKMKKTALVAALSAGAVFGGLAQNANAYVYGNSWISITDLQIAALNISNVDGSPSPATVSISDYNQTITNTSSLNGVAGSLEVATCSYSGAGACPGDTTTPGTGALDADVSEVGFSYGENAFPLPYHGPDDASEYSRGDGIIYQAAVIQIRDDASLASTATTELELQAESQLVGGFAATSSSLITSTTGLVLQFSVSDANAFSIFFNAEWDQLVDIDTGGAANSATANTEMTVTATLTKDGTSSGFEWKPGGGFGSSCTTNLGTCTTAEDGDLNELLGVSSEGASADNFGTGSFSLFIDGLSDGDWTLALNAGVESALSQDIPIPGTLAIFGLGLAGLGLAGRRRRRVAQSS